MTLPLVTQTSDFAQLRRSESPYVDKTRLIYDMVSEEGYYLLTRPQGFGKSLLCSTLECLFKGRRELFEGLYIAEHTDYDFKPCPVIHLNFSLLNTLDYESFVRGFQFLLRQQAVQNGVDLSRDDLPSYMMELLNALDEPCAIIIDEFDTPVTDCIFDHEKMLRIREAFSSFYSVIKNMGSKVRFFFVTGVTKLTGLVIERCNNLTDISMREGFSSVLGYTLHELVDSFGVFINDYLALGECPYRGMGDLLAALDAHYAGYRFSPHGGNAVFKPSSIASFFSSCCRIEDYWEAFGLTARAVQIARQKNLLPEHESRLPMVAAQSLSTFDMGGSSGQTISASYIYALLFFTGCLTIRESVGRTSHLAYPNNEVLNTVSSLI